MSVKSPIEPQLAAKRSVYLVLLSRWLTNKVMILHSSSSKITKKVWMLARTLANPSTFPASHFGERPNNRSKTQEQQTQPAPIKWTCIAFFWPRHPPSVRGGNVRGGGGEANVGVQWDKGKDGWALTQWVRRNRRSYLVIYWQHCVKHFKAQGAHNFHTMVMHKHFIPNIYIEVTLTADDKLFHNLICVPNCEVARDGINHLCKGSS